MERRRHATAVPVQKGCLYTHWFHWPKMNIRGFALLLMGWRSRAKIVLEKYLQWVLLRSVEDGDTLLIRSGYARARTTGMRNGDEDRANIKTA